MSNGEFDKIDFAEFEAQLNMTWRVRLRNVGQHALWGLYGISTGMSLAGIAVMVISMVGIVTAGGIAPAIIAPVAAVFGALVVSVGAYSAYKMRKRNEAIIAEIQNNRIELQGALIDAIDHERWQEGLESLLDKVKGKTLDAKIKNIFDIKKIGPLDKNDFKDFYDPLVFGTGASKVALEGNFQEFFKKYQKYRTVYNAYNKQKESKLDNVHYTVKMILQSYDKEIVRAAYQDVYTGMESEKKGNRKGDIICAKLVVILCDMPGSTFAEKMKYVLDDDYQELMPQIKKFTADFPELVKKLGGVSRYKRRKDVQGLGISHKLEKREAGSKAISLGNYALFAVGGLTTGFGLVLGIGLLILGIAALTATPVGWAILGVSAVAGITMGIAAVGYKIYQDKQAQKLESSLNNASIELSNITEKTEQAITLDRKQEIISEKRAALVDLNLGMGRVTTKIDEMKLDEQWIGRKNKRKNEGGSVKGIAGRRDRRRRKSVKKGTEPFTRLEQDVKKRISRRGTEQ